MATVIQRSQNPSFPGGRILLWRRKSILPQRLDSLESHYSNAHCRGKVFCSDQTMEKPMQHKAGKYVDVFLDPESLSFLSFDAILRTLKDATTLSDCLPCLLHFQASPEISAGQCAVVALITAKLIKYEILRDRKLVRFSDHLDSSNDIADPSVHLELASIVTSLLDRTKGHMVTLDSSQLVDMAWSCGVLRELNGGGNCDAWWNELVQALFPHLNALPPENMIRLLWGFAYGHATQNASFGAALLSNLEYNLAGLRMRDLVLIMWAAAKLKLQPSPSWAETFLPKIIAHVHLLNRSQVVTLICCLAKLKMSTPPRTCNLLAMACISQLEGMTASQTASIFWALGKLRAPIKWQILSPLVDHFKTLIPFASGTELAAVINALPSISCYPTAPKQLVNHKKYFLMALAHRSGQDMSGCSPRQLVQMILGFNRLGYSPGAMWMKLHREACIARQAEFDEISKLRVRRAYQLLLDTSK